MKHYSVTALFAVFMAVAFVMIGVFKPSNRTSDRIGGLLFDGAACGPLLLIVISPFSQVAGIGPDFLDDVAKGEAALLWVAVTYAAVNLLWKLL